jgi:hypothetical protein
MAGFDIEFATPTGPFVLSWKINDNKLSLPWLRKLDFVAKEKVIDNPHRFYGMPPETQEQVYATMTEAIQELNSKGFDIPVKPIADFNNHWLNYLHDYFAENHGRDTEQKSIEMVQHLVLSWNKLHIGIHRYEDLLKGTEEPRRLVATWRRQGECMDVYDIEDYEKFTFGCNFGDVFINYREVGKPAFDIFENQDLLDKSVLVNSTHWCADLNIQFRYLDNAEVIAGFWDWYDTKQDWFSEKYGFGPRDLRASPGYYPVASLCTDLSESEIISRLSESSGIAGITVKFH